MGDLAILEHTVGQRIVYEGVGLHTGKTVKVTINPAPPSTGIVFRRTNRSLQECVKASYRNISKALLATTIGFNGTGVSTVEHLLAAFFGCGIDNAIVDVDGPEIPIADGSALTYVKLIIDAGIAAQDVPKRFYTLKAPVRIDDGDAYLIAMPSDSQSLVIDYSIEFSHPLVKFQTIRWCFDSNRFVNEIAPARTFGFLEEVSRLKAQELALGGSLENAIVFDKHSLLNVEGFRFPDECVRHKVLDLLGDIMLIGKPIIGHFVIHKGGHRLHHKLLRKILPVLEAIPAEETHHLSHYFFPPNKEILPHIEDLYYRRQPVESPCNTA